jgi:hypothetical protein
VGVSLQFFMSPLVGVGAAQPDRRARLLLFICWLALVAWLCSTHVFWRDEVRAFSLALSGSNYVEMLRNVHGEGHPATWYLILRSAHDLFPYREVLPIAGALIGIAAMAIVVFFSPFRTIIVAAIIFSLYGAFEFVAMARNYGMSALVMFLLAATYQRVRNNPWFGLILAVLCNTNVPSCLLAAAFLLFRFVEMLTDGSDHTRRDWLVFGGNALLAAFGAYLCFITVYPPFNDQAVSRNLNHPGISTVISALVDSEWGFAHLAFDPLPPFKAVPLNAILLAISCLGFIRRPAAIAASFAALVAFKLFFYFVYFSSYRHEILYVIFLLSLYWMVANGAGGAWRHRQWHDGAQFVGAGTFVALLLLQTGRLLNPVHMQLNGIPDSRAADVATLLKRPELSKAIVMADPDTNVEPLPYYVDNPIWLLRQQRFGHVVPLSTKGRHELSMDDVLADADRLHRRTGRPIVFLSHIELQDRREERFPHMIFRDATTLRPDEVRRFFSSTQLIAKLWGAGSDEEYDVYVYPASVSPRAPGRNQLTSR